MAMVKSKVDEKYRAKLVHQFLSRDSQRILMKNTTSRGHAEKAQIHAILLSIRHNVWAALQYILRNEGHPTTYFAPRTAERILCQEIGKEFHSAKRKALYYSFLRGNHDV